MEKIAFAGSGTVLLSRPAVAGSDSHNSGAPYRQNNFFGGDGNNAGPIEARMSGHIFTGSDVRWESPAGLTVVWAEENTRTSIWNAMHRNSVSRCRARCRPSRRRAPTWCQRPVGGRIANGQRSAGARILQRRRRNRPAGLRGAGVASGSGRPAPRDRLAELVPAYLVGSLGAFWLLQRLAFL